MEPLLEFSYFMKSCIACLFGWNDAKGWKLGGKKKERKNWVQKFQAQDYRELYSYIIIRSLLSLMNSLRAAPALVKGRIIMFVMPDKVFVRNITKDE